jgi:hypothetical protein
MLSLSFLNRFLLHKLVAGGERPARLVVEALLRELPELLLACVVDVPSGKVLAYYTAQAHYSPYHLSRHYTQLLGSTHHTLASQPWLTGPLTELTVVLDEDLHHLRPLHNEQWYCFVAVHIADTNLALLKDAVRHSTSTTTLYPSA